MESYWKIFVKFFIFMNRKGEIQYMDFLNLEHLQLKVLLG
jgi:hypothetical protein